ncbi:MAG: hypothetical protein ABFD89_21480 [Bryobacteraceae bacterium]
MQFMRVTSAVALFLLFGTIGPAYAQRDRQNEKQGKAEKQQGRQQKATPPAAQQQRSQGQAQQPQQRQSAQRPQQQRAQQTQQQRPQQQRVQQTQQPQQRQSAQQPQQQRAQETQQQRPQQQQAQPYQQTRQQQQPQRTRQQAVAWQQQRGWQQQGAWQGGSTWQQGRARQWEREHRTWVQRGGYGGYYIPQATFGLYFGRQHFFRLRSLPTFYMGYPRFSYGGFSFLLLDPWPEYWEENWYDADDVYVDYDDGYYLYNRRYPSVRLSITVVM